MPIYKGDTPIVEASGRKGADGTNGRDGIDGENGATYTPFISEDGILSWTNDKNLPNPEPVNIKGQDGVSYTLTKSEDGTKIILTGSDGSVQEILDSNTIYSEATQTESGLMSAEDKAKLDNMSSSGEIQMTTTVATLCDSSGSTIALTDNVNNYDFILCTVIISDTTKTLVGVKGIAEVIKQGTARLDVKETTAKASWRGTDVSMKNCRIMGVKFNFS